MSAVHGPRIPELIRCMLIFADGANSTTATLLIEREKIISELCIKGDLWIEIRNCAADIW